MLQKLLSLQRRYTDYFFSQLDEKKADELLHMLLRCKGVIFFSGVGKSGFIAQKIASTMVSTGTKALFVPAVDALHGDLGIVTPDDVFILLSKSGETEELLALLPHIRNKGAKAITLTSNPEGRMAKESDFFLHLPLERELCPFDLAPTTSMGISLLFGDVLTVALMKAKNFSLGAYAKNHPSGRIGKRAQVFVEDLMLTGVGLPKIYEEEKVSAGLVELANKRCGCLLVVDGKNILKGLFTDGDLARLLKEQGTSGLQKEIQEVMTRKPRVTFPRALAFDAMKQMEEIPEHPITVLPVIDQEQKILGLIKMHDIIQAGIA